MEPDDVVKTLCSMIIAVLKRQTNVSGVSGSKLRWFFFVYLVSQKIEKVWFHTQSAKSKKRSSYVEM